MFFFKQKTADEMRISDWSSDVCSSDLHPSPFGQEIPGGGTGHAAADDQEIGVHQRSPSSLSIRIAPRKAATVRDSSSGPCAAEITPPGRPWMSTPPTNSASRSLRTLSASKPFNRSEQHTSELQSLMRISYPV